MHQTTSEKSVLAEAEGDVNGVEENIPNLDFLGTNASPLSFRLRSPVL